MKFLGIVIITVLVLMYISHLVRKRGNTELIKRFEAIPEIHKGTDKDTDKYTDEYGFNYVTDLSEAFRNMKIDAPSPPDIRGWDLSDVHSHKRVKYVPKD